MEKATQTVNGLRPTFKTQSDRFYSKGVDKKHNSYARYLARKKGKTICCCACTQLVTRTAGIAASSWPDTIPIGATIFGDGERQGIVVAVNKSSGKIISITIRSKYCLNPYYAFGVTPYFRIPAASGDPTYTANPVLLGLTIKTINIC